MAATDNRSSTSFTAKREPGNANKRVNASATDSLAIVLPSLIAYGMEGALPASPANTACTNGA